VLKDHEEMVKDLRDKEKLLEELEARAQGDLADSKVRHGSLACTFCQCQGCMSSSSL